MEIKVEQFCSLATSPSWQAWLYRYNSDLYKSFITRIQASRGCSQNKDIMKETLEDIGRLSGHGQLMAFLQQNYPHMIVSPATPKPQSVVGKVSVFEHFNPSALTYPRRKIFEGEHAIIRRQIRDFTIDKLKHDSIIIDGKGYVEYLLKTDSAIAEKIPASNWQIAAYRLRVT